MQTSHWSFGEGAFDSLIERKHDEEMPEFDITAMVDLVFMMNIYFLVTFVTVSLGSMNLPAAAHCSPLDADTAVTIKVIRSLDGQSISVVLGDDDQGEQVTDPGEQERRVHTFVEQGASEGKTAILLKAEKKVRLADLFRITSAAAVEGMKLHVGVVEKDES